MAAELPAETIIWRALIAMFVCWIVGRLVGWLAFRALQAEIEQYKRDHPIQPLTTADEGEPSALTEQTTP